MAASEPQFEGMGGITIPPLDQYLQRIANESLGWTVAVVLAVAVAFLAGVIYWILVRRAKQDQQTIERLATVIANNTTTNQLLTEAVKGVTGRRSR